MPSKHLLQTLTASKVNLRPQAQDRTRVIAGRQVLRQNEETQSSSLPRPQTLYDQLSTGARRDAFEKALPGLILCLGPGDRCCAVTPSTGLERWGLPDEIVGRHILDLLPPAAREAASSGFRVARATGDTQVVQYALNSADSRCVRHVEAHVAASDQDDLVLVVHDVTETRHLKDAVLKLLVALSLPRERAAAALLPICAWCNKVRDDQDEWQTIGHLLREVSLSSTTHSICPDCTQRETERFLGTST